MRLIDRILVLVALVMFGQSLVQGVTKHWDELTTGNARRPPPSWQARPPAPVPEQAAPRRPPPGLALLPPPSERDPVLKTSPSAPRRANQLSTGTAFAAGRDGAWLTARHVIDGCGRVLIRRGQGWDPAAVEFADPSADIAVLRARGGGPLLPVSEGPLAIGEPGYAFGFAGQGGASAIHAALLGRARSVQTGRMSGATPVLAWAERAIMPPGERWIGGMSGGPLVTSEGAVVGVMSVASERRGRIYTVAPETIGRAVRQNGLPLAPADTRPVPAGPGDFDAARAALMNRRTVVQVLCGA